MSNRILNQKLQIYKRIDRQKSIFLVCAKFLHRNLLYCVISCCENKWFWVGIFLEVHTCPPNLGCINRTESYIFFSVTILICAHTNLKMVFICPHPGCNKQFTRNTNLNRHYQNIHTNDTVVEKCFLCDLMFANCNDLQTHYRKCHVRTKRFNFNCNSSIIPVLGYRL